MLTLFKALKLALPLTTVASATAITASLVSTRKEDLKLNEKNDDRVLQDFENPTEVYEEKVINYPKDLEQEQEDKKNLKKLFQDQLTKTNNRKLVEKLLKDPEALVEDLLKKEKNLTPEEAVQKVLEDVIRKNESKTQQELENVGTYFESNDISREEKIETVSEETSGAEVGQIGEVLERVNQELESKISSIKEEGHESSEIKEEEVLNSAQSSSAENGQGENQCKPCLKKEKESRKTEDESKNSQENVDLKQEVEDWSVETQTDTDLLAKNEEEEEVSSVAENERRDSGFLNDGDVNSDLSKEEQISKFLNLQGLISDTLLKLEAKVSP